MDVWWNPFVHEQCEDRTYRIGQKKEVFVKYLVASTPALPRPSLDQIVMALGNSKRSDAAALLGGKGSRDQRPWRASSPRSITRPASHCRPPDSHRCPPRAAAARPAAAAPRRAPRPARCVQQRRGARRDGGRRQ